MCQLWYAPHFCGITKLFLGRQALPRGYRTQISHTWQQWLPFDPNRVYSRILWVDVMTCWKLWGLFAWIFQIVFAITFYPLLLIRWDFRWKYYLKLSSKWLQSQVCAPSSLGAVIFWRLKNFDDYWQKKAPVLAHLIFYQSIKISKWSFLETWNMQCTTI